jgi:predicted double-glycine peptidase
MTPDLTLEQISASGCDFEEILEFAATYDGYRRIAGSPENLSAVYEPIRMDWRKSGVLPGWMGIDLLRGFLFLMYRENHFVQPMGCLSEEEVEHLEPFRQVIEAIRRQCV